MTMVPRSRGLYHNDITSWLAICNNFEWDFQVQHSLWHHFRIDPCVSSMVKVKVWPANRPFSQSKTEFQRVQLNEVGLKELFCQLGAWSLNTTHVWPLSTAPQPDGLDWESILRREETGVPEENPQSQVEIEWNWQPTYNICCRGDWCPLRQPDFPRRQHRKSIQTVTHPDINPIQQGLRGKELLVSLIIKVTECIQDEKHA